ncbi:MAG: class I SAM-dependent methyltransferase, partial [Bacteroidia bacterium]
SECVISRRMSNAEAEKPWFEGWFDSPYYHILYHKRNEEEAARFISRLYTKLNPPPGSRALDLACGKGRHSVELNKLGLDVTGIDLSPSSIETASAFAKDGLEFYVHDMRRPFRIRYYDLVFNLFTSFGYFNHERENRAVLESVYKGLKPGGHLVIDFFNAECVNAIIGTGKTYSETVDGIEFNIKKNTDGKFVHKCITFTDKGTEYRFREQVQLFRLNDFRNLLEGLFEVTDIFGDYNLNSFDEKVSSRLILIARKR